MTTSRRIDTEESGYDARWLRLLLDITEIANDKRSLDNALISCLRRVCHHNGWQTGYCRLAEGGREFWWSEDRQTGGLEGIDPSEWELVRKWSNRVIELGRVQQVNDFSAASMEQTTSVDGALNAGGAIATPLIVEFRAVGAMTFVSRHPLDQDLLSKDPDGLLRVMESIGTQIGRSVERWQLLRRIAEVAERERTSLGQEIHDNLAQQLVGVKLLAQNLRKKMGAKAEEHDEEWKLLLSNLVEAQDQARSLARGLSAGMIPEEENSLADRLEDLCEVVRTGHGLDCELRTEGKFVLEDELEQVNLWHIAREAVFNALRHADPKRIDLDLIADGDQTRLEIHDDGSGFADADYSEGMGISSMRHRAELIGGRLELQSTPGEGTVVRCVLPIR